MEEKTIITSERGNKTTLLTIGIVFAFLSLLSGPFCVFFIVFDVIFLLNLSKCELTVTNQFVYGTAIFGKRVALPLDSISALGLGMFEGIEVSTSSGWIRFFLIKNRGEIYDSIHDLLVERKSKN